MCVWKFKFEKADFFRNNTDWSEVKMLGLSRQFNKLHWLLSTRSFTEKDVPAS